MVRDQVTLGDPASGDNTLSRLVSSKPSGNCSISECGVARPVRLHAASAPIDASRARPRDPRAQLFRKPCIAGAMGAVAGERQRSPAAIR